jgi:hypothetical protein
VSSQLCNLWLRYFSLKYWYFRWRSGRCLDYCMQGACTVLIWLTHRYGTVQCKPAALFILANRGFFIFANFLFSGNTNDTVPYKKYCMAVLQNFHLYHKKSKISFHFVSKFDSANMSYEFVQCGGGVFANTIPVLCSYLFSPFSVPYYVFRPAWIPIYFDSWILIRIRFIPFSDRDLQWEIS